MIDLVKRKTLFKTNEGKQFPKNIIVNTNLKSINSDIDIIIGIHGNYKDVNAVIENYILMEQKLKLHFIIINTSLNYQAFKKILDLPNVTKIQLISPIKAINKYLGGKLFASNSVGLVAQLGLHYSKSDLVFYSHPDMVAYKRNFLSYLKSKMDENTIIASFTQRHILPFTGCMLYKKNYFKNKNVDWMPKAYNKYKLQFLSNSLINMPHMDWIDCGEELIYECLNNSKTVYVAHSVGITGNTVGQPNDKYNIKNQDLIDNGVEIKYDFSNFNFEILKHKYPELNHSELDCWRKTIDDTGDIIFIHRGRGTTSKMKDNRGDFLSFTIRLNETIKKQNN